MRSDEICMPAAEVRLLFVLFVLRFEDDESCGITMSFWSDEYEDVEDDDEMWVAFRFLENGKLITWKLIFKRWQRIYSFMSTNLKRIIWD